MESPYNPVSPTFFILDYHGVDNVIVRLRHDVSVHDAIAKMETVFRKYNPDIPFDYQFTNQEFARKFYDEERIGNIASVFAILAISISCLGLFGLASFVAEQRTKEIGVRKILGASLFSVWYLISRDFVVLVIISVLISSPTAYYFMHNWLQNYQYQAGIPWWIFIVAGMGAIVITMLTVGYQSIRAALMNPVKSLRTE